MALGRRRVLHALRGETNRATCPALGKRKGRGPFRSVWAAGMERTRFDWEPDGNAANSLRGELTGRHEQGHTTTTHCHRSRERLRDDNLVSVSGELLPQ